MLRWLELAVTAWIVTTLITRAHALAWARSTFRAIVWELLPHGIASHFTQAVQFADGARDYTEPDNDEPADARIYGFDMVTCALCVGAWVSLAVVFLAGVGISWWLPVYGASYFLDKISDQ